MITEVSVVPLKHYQMDIFRIRRGDAAYGVLRSSMLLQKYSTLKKIILGSGDGPRSILPAICVTTRATQHPSHSFQTREKTGSVLATITQQEVVSAGASPRESNGGDKR